MESRLADNIYIFRYSGHQSMFIVMPDGVIATDPISERRPAKPYFDATEARRSNTPSTAIAISITSPVASRSRTSVRPLSRTGMPGTVLPRSSPVMSSSRTRSSTAAATSHSAVPRWSSIMLARTTPTARWYCGYRERRSSSLSIGFRSKAYSSAAWPTLTCLTSREG